jgi:hypothetical protein
MLRAHRGSALRHPPAGLMRGARASLDMEPVHTQLRMVLAGSDARASGAQRPQRQNQFDWDSLIAALRKCAADSTVLCSFCMSQGRSCTACNACAFLFTGHVPAVHGADTLRVWCSPVHRAKPKGSSPAR